MFLVFFLKLKISFIFVSIGIVCIVLLAVLPSVIVLRLFVIVRLLAVPSLFGIASIMISVRLEVAILPAIVLVKM